MRNKLFLILIFTTYTTTGFSAISCVDFYSKPSSKTPSLTEYIDDLARLQLEIYNQTETDLKSVMVNELKGKIKQVSTLFGKDVRSLLAEKYKILLMTQVTREHQKSIEEQQLPKPPPVFEFNEMGVVPINYGNTGFGRSVFLDHDGNVLLGTGNFKFNPNGNGVTFDLERISLSPGYIGKEPVFTITQRPNNLITLAPDYYLAVRERGMDGPFQIILLDKFGTETFVSSFTPKNYNYVSLVSHSGKNFILSSEGKISLIDFDPKTLKVSFTDLPESGISELPRLIEVTDNEVRALGRYDYQYLWVKKNGQFQPVDIKNEPRPFRVLANGDRAFFDSSKKLVTIKTNGNELTYPVGDAIPNNFYQTAKGHYIIVGTVPYRDSRGTNWRHLKLFLAYKDAPNTAPIKFDLPNAEYVTFKTLILTKNGALVGIVDRNELSFMAGAYRTDDIISYHINEDTLSLTTRNLIKIKDGDIHGVAGEIHELPNGNLFFNPYASGQAFVIPLMEKLK